MSQFKDRSDIHIELNSNEAPALLMQPDPRQVVSANKKACELFGKNISQIQGCRGGQVFDCIHSFSEEGCGKDSNCEECKIKNAVVDTFTTGKPHNDIQTILDIKKQETTTPYQVQISTKKLGDHAIITIHTYQKVS